MSIQLQLRRDVYSNVAANHGAVGEVFVDTTNKRIVVQDGAFNGGFPTPIVLSAQAGGDTNDSSSGSGSDHDHNLVYTIPAGFMIANRVFRVTAHYQLTTGSAPPSLVHKIKLGALVLLSSAGITPGPNQTNVQTGFQWFFQAAQAPGAASNVHCAAVESLNTFGVTGVGITPMPVVAPTNADQDLMISTQWSDPGTGATSVGLNQLIIEALN